MKIRELIQELAQYDPEFEVLTAVDPEGNGFHKGICIELEQYEEQGRDICLIHPDDYDNGDAEEPWTPNCVVVWP